jgi:hypothetical protein
LSESQEFYSELKNINKLYYRMIPKKFKRKTEMFQTFPKRQAFYKILGHTDQFAGKTAHVIRKCFSKIVLELILISKKA